MMKQNLHNPPARSVRGLNEDGNPSWRLEYFFNTYPGPCDKSTRYGMTVSRINPDGTLDKSTDTGPFSDSPKEVMLMLKQFSKNLIHPYVVQDMVDEWYSTEAMKSYRIRNRSRNTRFIGKPLVALNF